MIGKAQFTKSETPLISLGPNRTLYSDESCVFETVTTIAEKTGPEQSKLREAAKAEPAFSMLKNGAEHAKEEPSTKRE
jgi:hypothetical protein